MIRPYDEMIAEMRAKWESGVALLREVTNMARQQGFLDDGELSYKVSCVSGGMRSPHSLTPIDPMDRLRALSATLDRAALRHGYRRGPYDVWAIHPAGHARDNAFWTFPSPSPSLPKPPDVDHGIELFRMVDRVVDGDDLVYASIPGQ